MKNVAILGLGRTARAAAAYLTERGCSVTMWGRNAEAAARLREDGLNVVGALTGHYTPAVCDAMADAVKGAQLILVSTLAAGHAPVARQLSGLLEREQRIVILNGNWGAYEFMGILGEETEEKQVEIAETGAQIFLADYDGEACRIKGIKKEISLAAVHAHKAAQLCGELAQLFPQFVPASSVIATSLNNSNPVLHAPIALFNITRMENGDTYSFYGDGASPMVFAAVEKLDEERCAVARAMGAQATPCLDIINSFWPDQYKTLYDAVKNNAAYLSAAGPTDPGHRYLSEDMPYGMAPVSRLGDVYGIATPYTDALLTCCHMLTGVDYLAQCPAFDPALLQRLLK